MKECQIQLALWRKYSGHKYKFLNTYFFREESDFLSFTTSKYCYEVEIKVSVSDFKRDFFKLKHEKMKRKDPSTPNRFFFACPTDLIKKVPKYAGLIYVDEYLQAKVIKNAPMLHKRKHSPKRVFNKMYYFYESIISQQLYKSSLKS